MLEVLWPSAVHILRRHASPVKSGLPAPPLASDARRQPRDTSELSPAGNWDDGRTTGRSAWKNAGSGILPLKVADWGIKRMRTRWGTCNITAKLADSFAW